MPNDLAFDLVIFGQEVKGDFDVVGIRDDFSLGHSGTPIGRTHFQPIYSISP